MLHHGAAEGSCTQKARFGHRSGSSPCAHSIGKFLLWQMVFFPFEASGSWLARLYLYYICFCLSSVAKTARIVCPILHPLYRMTLRAHDHGAHVELEVCRASDRAFSPQPLHTKEIFDQRHCTPRSIYKRLRQESFRQSAFSTQEVSARRLCAKRGSGLRNKTMQTRAALDCKAEQDHASKQQ